MKESCGAFILHPSSFILRIEIDPHGLRAWAFVTITNNATEHVTVVTPQ